VTKTVVGVRRWCRILYNIFYYALRSARDVIKKHRRRRLRIAAFRADFSRTFRYKHDGGAPNSLCVRVRYYIMYRARRRLRVRRVCPHPIRTCSIEFSRGKRWHTIFSDDKRTHT